SEGERSPERSRREGGYGHDRPRREGEYRSDRPRREGGYQSDRPRREGGYQSDKPRREGGYQSDRPRREGGYQSDRPRREGGYQSDKPRREGGYQSDRPRREGGYQSDKPRREGGYQSDRPRREGGYQSDRPRREGGYRSDKPRREGGYQSDRPRREGGYQSDRPRREGGPRSDRPGKPGFKKPFKKETAGPEPKQPKVPGEVRLNKFIANSGLCSRREADTFISTGLVTVNGEVADQLGIKIKPGDDVRVNGERMKGEPKTYIVMNKPRGFVTTMQDDHAEKSVMDLIAGQCEQRVYPVGRLDKSTMGVLLFTNDGDLTEKLTHPSYNRKKIYQARLDKNLKKTDMDQLVNGVELEDGPMHVDMISYIDNDEKEIGLEIHSGKNRVVRRLFEALGYKVKKLDRVYFAGMTKKNLKRGQWRFLTQEEINMLKTGFYE
ncbi:MAG: pseudouridine synthase, partial [Bacteroidales bacterium]|nr:pseudouridine synthase [Bacteroidales bacterium]